MEKETHKSLELEPKCCWLHLSALFSLPVFSLPAPRRQSIQLFLFRPSLLLYQLFIIHMLSLTRQGSRRSSASQHTGRRDVHHQRRTKRSTPMRLPGKVRHSGGRHLSATPWPPPKTLFLLLPSPQELLSAAGLIRPKTCSSIQTQLSFHLVHHFV